MLHCETSKLLLQCVAKSTVVDICSYTLPNLILSISYQLAIKLILDSALYMKCSYTLILYMFHPIAIARYYAHIQMR